MATKNHRSWRALLPALLAAGSSACGGVSGADEEDGNIDEASSAIRGYENYDAPEIGMLSSQNTVNHLSCTATAILPNVLITAAHCVRGGGGNVGGGSSFYTIQGGIREYRVRGEPWRSGCERCTDPARDIALLRVEPAVPWTRELGAYAPGGTSAYIWGFGGDNCHESESDPNGWAYDDGLRRKRVAFFTVNGITTPGLACPGDSGGPIIRADGRIFGITSKSSGTEATDIGIFENVGDIWHDVTLAAYLMQVAP